MIDDATTDAKQFSQITFSAGDPVPGPVAAFIPKNEKSAKAKLILIGTDVHLRGHPGPTGVRRLTLTEGRKFKLPVGVLPRYAEKEPQRPRFVNDARHIANKGVT